MEIDEYRDYEKALNALKRAGEYMTKARGDASREEKVPVPLREARFSWLTR